MSRDLTAGVLAAIQAADVSPILLFEGEFADGTVRLWTGVGDLTWNSQTWNGAGSLIGMAAVEETDRVEARGVTVSLSGVPTELVSAAIDGARQGLPGRVWLGFLDAAGAVIADPVQVYTGRLDVPEIADGADTCTVALTYEGRLIDMTRPREFRYTDESQQVLYPGDRGFEYVAAIQGREITWGLG